jgi:hypothetical protein
VMMVNEDFGGGSHDDEEEHEDRKATSAIQTTTIDIDIQIYQVNTVGKVYCTRGCNDDVVLGR